MSLNRGLRTLLAAALLTTAAVGCTTANTPIVNTDTGKPTDSTKPGGDLTNPGDQLLSNSAATAIADITAALRDVGALKHMASQQPLLSNSGSGLLSNAAGSLLSNGMGGYRILSTGLAQSDYDRIEWTDSNPIYPAAGEVAGTITGTLDGVKIEEYSYSAEIGETTYSRTEVVTASRFREKGTYVVSGETVYDYANYPDVRVHVTGTSTFDPDGVNRQLTYAFTIKLLALENDDVLPVGAESTVKGTLPNGAEVDLTMTFVEAMGSDPYVLAATGSFTFGSQTIGFRTTSTLLDDHIKGSMGLGFSDDFWLNFAFESNQPLVSTLSNKDEENLGELTYTEDKKYVIINHPDKSKEHLELDLLPKLYIFGLSTTLPPL